MSANEYAQLRQIRGVGEKRYNQIVDALTQRGQTLDNLFQMDASQIKANFGLPINVAQTISEYGKSTSEVKTELKQRQTPQLTSPLAEKNVLTLHYTDDLYPAKITTVLNGKAPKTLYVWGNLDLLNRPSVGFCGSRAVTQKGIQVVVDVVQQITELGWVTVSGHAKGVDTTAHLTAVENGGSTIIVAAEGILTFKLRQEIKKLAKPEQLLIVSEFNPDDRWTAGRAMQRNRTILGLSDGMVLIESRLEGGTFNAGQTALKLNVPLFVAQYELSAESNAGNRHFLERGAVSLLKNKQTGRANITALQEMVERRNTSVFAQMDEKIHEPIQVPMLL